MSEAERIVLIEWNSDGTIHQIVTTTDDDARYINEHDVNWYQGQGYIHCSGGGPGPCVFLPGKADGYRGKLWAAPEITFQRWLPPVRGAVSIERENLHEIGYDLIDAYPGDPRPDLIEDAGYSCDLCDETWYPNDEPCEHGFPEDRE